MEEQNKEKKGNWYDRNYKFMLILPLILLILSLGYLWNFNNINGDLIIKDVSLTGGTTVSIFDSGIDAEDLELILGMEFDDLVVREISDLRTGEQKGIIIDTSVGVDEITDALEDYLGYDLNGDNSSIEFTGAALSEGFYQQLRFAILIAFVFMAIIVFLIFRSFVPSLAVVLSAFADIIMTVALVDLLGMKLGVAGIIAFLMLIGYSVDTDILLTSRLLRRRGEGTVNGRIFDSFKTGITMTLTSIFAVAIALVITFGVSETLRQIFTILLIGLGFDIINTWFANASILKWYTERKEARY